MFCTKCGKELFDEAVICPQCGTPTENYVQPAPVAASQGENCCDLKLKAVGLKKEVNNYKELVSTKPFFFIDVLFGNDTVSFNLRDKEYERLVESFTTGYKDIHTERKNISSFTVLIIKSQGFALSLYAQNSKFPLNKLAYALARKDDYDIRSDLSINKIENELIRRKA